MSTATLDRQQSAPDRSLEQRLSALRNANRIRFYRAELKRQVGRGQRDPLALLLDPPAELDTMRVFDLLLAVPKVGRVKVNRAMVRCHVSPSKSVGGLTDRQRVELVQTLTNRRS